MFKNELILPFSQDYQNIFEEKSALYNTRMSKEVSNQEKIEGKSQYEIELQKSIELYDE